MQYRQPIFISALSRIFRPQGGLRRSLLGWALLLGAWPFAGLAQSSGQDVAPAPRATVDRNQPESSVAEAQDWMRRMAEARKLQNYEGVFVYGRGEDVNAVQILHRFQNGKEQERLLHLDGEKREILREGEKVYCLLPGEETVALEQSIPSGPFSGPYAANTVPVGPEYNVTINGGGRIAGYDALKLAVMATDEYRHSYLLWLDKQTALLLKSLVLNQQGETLERMQYTSLTIGGDIADSKFESKLNEAMASAKPAKRAQKDSQPLQHQWRPGWLPPGFKEAPLQIKRVASDPMRVDSQVYTDGLSSFSIFVEAAAGENVPAAVSHMGATIALTRLVSEDQQSYVITLVGEVPLATARKVADSMRLAETTLGSRND